jgi:hypothetical protein
MCELGSPEMVTSRETDCGDIGNAEPLISRRRRCQRCCLELSMLKSPGSVEDGMPGRNEQRKPGTTRGSPRALPHSEGIAYKRYATKSRCAREWGGWGRLSDDGPGQHNLVRSEGPRSRATYVARMAVFHRAGGSDTERRTHAATESTKGGGKPDRRNGNAGSKLNRSGIREGPI